MNLNLLTVAVPLIKGLADALSKTTSPEKLDKNGLLDIFTDGLLESGKIQELLSGAVGWTVEELQRLVKTAITAILARQQVSLPPDVLSAMLEDDAAEAAAQEGGSD